MLLITGVAAVPVASQAEGPWSLIGQGCALTVVSGVLVYLLTKFIPDQRAAFTATLYKITDRHDGWESQRTEDSKQLNETLTELRVHCARTHAQLPDASTRPHR